MKNTLINRTLLCVAIFLNFLSATTYAKQSREFSTSKTTAADAIYGQIDWPGGPLRQWQGPVLVLISSGNPNDRDGWLIRALETVWFDKTPLKTLSEALVREGIAVVRFDNPGVLPPKLKCRETILKEGLSDKLMRKRCLNVDVLQKLTVDRYISSIENVIAHVQTLMPSAKQSLVLFGFSEGAVHAATIVDRQHFDVKALLSLGAPAESFRTVTRWQGTERLIETLPEFDLDGDGIITNDEIREGYKKGIGRIVTSVDAWLSPRGQWNKEDLATLLQQYSSEYEQMVAQNSHPSELKKMNWVKSPNGVWVPDLTNSFWDLHFRGEVAPIEVMKRHAVPGLFLWGEKDRQVGLHRQMKLVQEAKASDAMVEEIRFPNRHHLLSLQKDLDWFEPEFASQIAKLVRKFLNEAIGERQH